MANQFLIKETMAAMRGLSAAEITALQNGTYEGVQLLGYYEKGDTPAPIIYYLVPTSSDPGPDDGGSVIAVGGIKLQHTFEGEIDVIYYGCKPKGLAFDNAPQLQRACDLKKVIVIRNIDPNNYYFIDKRIRLYNSIKGIGSPQIKVNPQANSFEVPSGYSLDRYTAFSISNKVDSAWLIVEGLDIDGWYDGLHKTGSEFEHNIHISSSNNIIIRDNILRNPCGDSIYIGKNTANQGTALLDYCSNVFIYNNRMTNQGRCGVSLVSSFNVKISENHIEKLWSYVCPIDLEPNGEQTDLMVQSTTIENNTIIGRESTYAINVYGATDSSYQAHPYPAIDYSTKDVIIFNNRLIAKETGVNIAASWGKIANVFVENNKISAPQMVNLSGTYRSTNINILGNYPYQADEYVNIGTFRYTDHLRIKNNVSKSNLGQSISVSRTKNVLIEGNNVKATGVIPAIRFAYDVSDIQITGNNNIQADSSCIKFNTGSTIEGFCISNNTLSSLNDHIIYSDNVMIGKSKIGINSWVTSTESKFLVNLPSFFNNSESEFFDGKRHFYVSTLPSESTLSPQDYGNIYTKKILSSSAYTASKAEAEKYMYFNGSLIGIGFKGEWFGEDVSLPSINTKIGHRYTNVNGGSGNTFYIREGGSFRAVQTIVSGTTANRPSNPALGFRYWDTSLNRAVYWTGSSWADNIPLAATTTTKGSVNQADASGDVAIVTSSTYSFTEVQGILAELRDLKLKLRTAGILAT
ncbi:right-handed parallel beta-helix repeat-containing protein [Sphingobacterium sp. HMA12]|uniref:right-handed parallel beta-helix repeat-containing protein n=1 Tax=Sphingobacterium sp. HMA12 TaxID=2050894 RepID=UPI000CEA6D06|nr:right-handed parallel beta-helix repeat-containing protein [Sphingobacterium sp. HMA12]